MPENRTFYDVLGVDEDAGSAAIEAAYRERVRELHPDVSDETDARERIQRVNRAREVLTDSTERTRYDRLGHETYLDRQRCGRTLRDDARADGDWERSGEWAAADTDTRQDASAAGTGGPATADEEPPSPGWFALLEAIAAFAALGVAGTAVAVTTLFGDLLPVNGRLLLAGCWLGVAVVAGRFAASRADALPDDVVRAQALPLALFVAAWYLNQLEGYLPLVSALLVYGVFGTVFRTAALIARRSRSFLLGAGLWFLGTVPAVLVLPATRLPAVGPDEPIPPKFVDIGTALPFAEAVPGGASAVAVGAPIAATVAYALWRLVRSLW